MNWTDEQREAIRVEGNVLVSAAAGSGKTAVLTERVIDRIIKGTDISEILVVTFTNLAAEEMKKRIETKLYERAYTVEDSKLKERLYAQAQGVAKANISTLHSFCLYLIKRNYFKTDLPPVIRPIDENEQELLMSEAMEETLDNLFDNDSSSAIKLISVFGGEEKLIEIIKQIYFFMCQRPKGEEWLSRAVEAYKVAKEELASSMLINEFWWRVKEQLKIAIYHYNKALDLVCSTSDSIYEALNDKLDYCDNAYSADSYELMICILENNKPKAKRGKAKDADYTDINKINAHKKQAEKALKATSKYKVSITDEAKKLNHLYPYMQQLAQAVLTFRDKYSKKKQQVGAIDFSDMENHALKLLNDPSICEACKERFKYIFVDEYQDINLLQDSIISAIKRDDNIFFVGDVKQSIYRFRNAEPKLFIKKAAQYSNGLNGCTLNLSSNFRSSDSVINFTNEIFSVIMNERTGEINYDETCKLKKEGQAGVGSIDFEIIEHNKSADNECTDAEEESNNENAENSEYQESETNTDDNEKEDDSEEEIDALEAEAKLAAQYIHDLMQSDGFYAPNEKVFRKYRYSDFAILMRSVANRSDIFASILAAEGIPCYTDQKGGFYDALEVQVFVNLLRVLNNRQQDIPLLSVMRSALGNFDAEELAKIRVLTNSTRAQGKKSVIDCLFEISAVNNPLGQKAKAFIEKLDKWYRYTQLITMEEIVSKLLHHTGYYAYVSALPNGYTRTLNLDMLKEVASAFDSNIGGGLHSFLRYLEGIAKSSQQSEAQDSSADVVQIMTIHKSKGLEFNVVIIPCLDRKMISKEPSSSNVLLHNDYGIGVRFIDLDTNANSKSLIFNANALVKTDEERSDAMRILYVALTRAREKLLLIASDKSAEGLRSTIQSIDKYGDNTVTQTLSAKSFYEWLLIGIKNSRYSDALNAALINGEGCVDTLRIKRRHISEFTLEFDDSKKEAVFNALDEFKNIELCDEDYCLTWEYPYIGAYAVPTKRSVTSLRTRISPPDVPLFIAEQEDTPLTAVQIGTATHLVFEKIAIKPHDESTVREEIKGLVEAGFLTQREADSIYIQGIVDFFTSDLGKRLIASPHYVREQEFICRMKADELLSSDYASEYMLLQGVIDCCFIENDKWVLIDYKTDNVKGYSQEELYVHSQHHIQQLRNYARALEIITKRKVKQAYIHYVYAGSVKMFDNIE